MSVSEVSVTLKKDHGVCNIIVTDNGDGFARLSDAYTLFASTPKRSNSNVRGRFNMGEKELASIARRMTIATTSGKVVFKNGKMTKHPRIKRDNGTVVDVTIPMNWDEYDEAVIMLGLFIYPTDKTVTVLSLSGKKHSVVGMDTLSHYIGSDNEILPTVKLNSETGFMSNTKRKTKIEIYKRFQSSDYTQQQGWLFELGIPVQEIECNYNVNVLQKVPMNANRDAVLESYLKKIYAIVLNTIADDLDEDTASETWVSQAIESDLSNDKALDAVMDQKYKNTVLRSSNSQANENAIGAGMTILDPRHLSRDERDRLRPRGLVPSSTNFAPNYKDCDRISPSKWSENMKAFADITKAQAKEMAGISSIQVAYINDRGVSSIAQFSRSIISQPVITYNIGLINGGENLDPYHYRNLGTMLHELAHNVGDGHDARWWRELANLGGKALQQSLGK